MEPQGKCMTFKKTVTYFHTDRMGLMETRGLSVTVSTNLPVSDSVIFADFCADTWKFSHLAVIANTLTQTTYPLWIGFSHNTFLICTILKTLPIRKMKYFRCILNCDGKNSRISFFSPHGRKRCQ